MMMLVIVPVVVVLLLVMLVMIRTFAAGRSVPSPHVVHGGDGV